MKILLLVSVLLFSSLILLSCKKNNPIPPEDQPQTDLTLEDVSCTEAWLKLSTSNITLPANVELLKDDSLNRTLNLTTTDTVIYIKLLLPNNTYSFHTILQPSSHTDAVASAPISVTTLDTTSHNFNWQTWTFGGQAGNCTLNDVAIIDEDNIWAVGEIYLLDSTGVPDPNAYNAVHWNGNQWRLKRIKTNACGGVDYPPIKAVFAFSSNDILFAHIDGSISHYNGIEFTNDCSLITQLNGSANKMWGISGNDFYVVSGNGFIAHYQNGHWGRIESGTTLPFQDIWGAQSNTGQAQILSIASNKFSTGGKYLVSISENNVVHLNDIIPTSVSLSGVWFVPDRRYYLVGDGIYEKHNLTENRWLLDSIIYQIQYYPYSVRGNGINDIVVCGEAGTISHFNGASWKIYEGDDNYDRLLSINLKNDIVIAVGTRYNNGINNYGVIYYGRR